MKTIVLLLTILFGQVSLAQHYHITDPPSVHGMLLFGQDKIYLSHLPMFHTPHNYQVLFEVEIPKSVKDKYTQSLKDNPNKTLYTIVPETFILPEIVKSSKSFKARLFKGHFERGGSPITNTVDFKIKKILYFKKFVPNEAKPKLSSYILIGNEKEQFLIHTIIAKPDFDLVTKVSIKKDIIKKELSKADHLMMNINSPNDQPLKIGKDYKAIPINNQAPQIEFKVIRPIYLEFGDLSF